MRLTKIHAQNFRNIALASLNTDVPAVFFLAPNGQGKTNILEAIGMITALRSFRTTENSAFIRQGFAEAKIRFEINHETEDACDVTLVLHPHHKEALINGGKLARLADLMGCYPTVALCADDSLLLRGAPAVRRRFLDMTLSVNAEYLTALTHYHRALKQRNAILKDDTPDAHTLLAFEREMATSAEIITRFRAEGLKELNHHLTSTYAAIATTDESPTLLYDCDKPLVTSDDFLNYWIAQRPRDQSAHTTRHGPHKDDLSLNLKGLPAREYASEGQQRALVLALKLAQSAFFLHKSGIRPIILADDVLGQLDPQRQQRFWNVIGNDHQIIATGTVLPPAPPTGPWHVYTVNNGVFTAVENTATAPHV